MTDTITPPSIVLDYIRGHFQYDPITGILTTKRSKAMGTKRKNGYVIVGVRVGLGNHLQMYYTLYAHQIGWFLTHGQWSESFIDHINGDPSDNRLTNLRLATHTQNMSNQRKPKGTHTSKYKGVLYRADCKLTKPWRAYINSGKRIDLGHYTTEEEAARAYDAKARELFGEYARLNFPD